MDLKHLKKWEGVGREEQSRGAKMQVTQVNTKISFLERQTHLIDKTVADQNYQKTYAILCAYKCRLHRAVLSTRWSITCMYIHTFKV